MPDRSLQQRRGARLAVALAAAAALLAAPQPAAAGFIGDPTFTNGAGRVSITGELDFVTDRDLDFDPGHGDLETMRVFANAGYGFGSNVDGFVKLGLFNGEFDPGGNDIDTSLAVGFGVKGAFVDRGEIRLGALGQVLYSQSELENSGADVDWFEIDLALAASFRGLGQIVPYAGVKVSLVDGEIDAPGGDFEQDDALGLFGGLTFAVSPQVALGAELRVLDETALGGFVRLLF
ncbi:MAG TPA: hypothetical protein VF406_01605 [Thermodesulfobacteriota bacterium]